MLGPSCLSHIHPELAPSLFLVVEGAHTVLAGKRGVDVEDCQVVGGPTSVEPVTGGRCQSRGAMKPTDVCERNVMKILLKRRFTRVLWPVDSAGEIEYLPLVDGARLWDARDSHSSTRSPLVSSRFRPHIQTS